VAEHDLAIIDYLSDQICIFYGEAGVYGIVSHVHGVRTGINIYLQGYIPDENIRFRKEAITFHEKPPTISFGAGETLLKWDRVEKTIRRASSLSPFSLEKYGKARRCRNSWGLMA
jgi:ATP-binding cassette subfamily E protein 1